MADKKRKSTSAKPSPKKSSSPTLIHHLAPYLIGFAAVFLAACLLIQDYVGFAKYIGVFLCGMFSWSAYSIPLFLMYMAVFYSSNHKNNVLRQKWVYMIFSVIFISVICSLISPIDTYTLSTLYLEGVKLHSGGVVGGYVYNVLALCIGPVGVAILAAVALLIFITLVFGKTPAYIFGKIIRGIVTFFKKLTGGIILPGRTSSCP